MKVLLINPPLREQYPPESFPYGLAYVAKYLIKAGHQVEILDIDSYRYDREEVVRQLDKYKCDLIGTGGMVTVYKYLKWLVPVLRNKFPHIKIMVGGSLATSSPEETLEYLKVDFVVIGEGEVTAPELVNYLQEHKKPKVEDLKKIKGIGFKHNGKLIFTQPRELIENLDEVGFPDWNLFAVEKVLHNRDNVFSILTERGSTFRCNFCYHQFGYRSRRRSMDNVVKEMKFLNKKYGIEYFSIADNLFVYNTREVTQLINAL